MPGILQGALYKALLQLSSCPCAMGVSVIPIVPMRKRRGLTQGHTSKSLAELGFKPGLNIYVGLFCLLLQKIIQNLKIRQKEGNMSSQCG